MEWLSPVNKTPMQEVLLEGVRVHFDETSGGYWLEKGELEQVAEHHHVSLQDQPLEVGTTVQKHQGRFCPEDQSELVEYEFGDHSGIKIDLCPVCGGVWVDGGELQQVIWYLDSQSDYAAEIEERQHHLPLKDRILAFLYALTERPPLY